MIIHQLFRSLSRDAGLLISSTVSEQGLRTAAFILMWHRLLSSRLADNYAQSIHMDLASIRVVRKRSSSVLRSASVYLVSTVQLHVDMATCCCCWWSLLYSVILRSLSRAESLRSHVILNECMTSLFIASFWISTEAVYLTALFGCYTAGATWNCCRYYHVKLLPFRCFLCTPCNPASCHVTSCKATDVRCMRA